MNRNTQRWTAIAATAALLPCAPVARAQCEADQVQEVNNGGTSERNLPGYFEWQSFTAGVTGPLCRVDLLFCNSNFQLNGTGTLNIHAGEGIGGALLGTQAVEVNGTAYTFNQVFWQTWTIDDDITVNAGSVYTFQFVPTQGGGLPDPYLIQVNIPSVYPGGQNYNLGVQGDCAFRTFVDPGTVGVGAPGHSVVALRTFPNPVFGELMLQRDEATPAQATVLDQAGREVLHFRIAGAMHVQDVSALYPGLYTLLLTSSGTVRIARFVKE